jgi:hypothetical protein
LRSGSWPPDRTQTTVAAAVGGLRWEGRELSRVGFGLWWAWAVACGASGGGVASRQEEGWQRVGRGSGARTARGGGWWRVGIGGVAGGDAPGDRGVTCGEGLGGSGDWGLARWCSNGEGRRMGIGGVAGGGTRGSEGWRCARLVWELTGGCAREEEHEECRLRWPTLLVQVSPRGLKVSALFTYRYS